VLVLAAAERQLVNSGYRFQSWFVARWARVALPCAVVILMLLPVLANEENINLVLVVTLLPVYMIHQYEEHARGRFMAFFNATVGEGHEVLTTRSIFWINIVGVWAVFLVSFYLARYVALGVALVPIYLTLVNGIIHVLASVRLRRYNPGLWTSLALFIPWGGLLLLTFRGVSPVPTRFDVGALLIAVAMHAGVVIYALRRRAALEAEGSSHR
jgi:hypothetical protein